MSEANEGQLHRLAYPAEAVSLHRGDVVIVRTRKGERKIPER